jgi:Domain of unknown function (DUF4167)
LARNFESNGPDVKIRGTAVHIAEKYMSLARDALASGDIIAAESYFQHAEHYNRIIMAAQSQFGPQHGGQPGDGPNGYRPRWNAEGDDDGDYDGVPETGGGGEQRSGGREAQGRRGQNGGEDHSRDDNGADADSEASDESAADPVT